MNSKILAKLPVRLPKEEVRLILDFQDDSQEYSEFHFGDWKTYVIWNQSGQDDDGRVADHGQAARPTPRGLGLGFLNNWMVRTFDVSKLKLARIHSMGEGVLIPHRDFVEFGKHTKPWTRVHVPLVTNSSCMHSDESTVFRMRQGEVWFLDAANLHSAVNFSTERRLNLCLDFDIGHAEVADVLLPAAFNDIDSLTPELVRRPPLEVSFEDTLLSLAAQL
ncbi:aspartyl/asparaginyl beta-hydroxylase domain-containing protein [Paraburkholderia hospita]|uniref:aspartyl/asparaginyl beta-hydroxylase domain-containing protein n=1 Tax=Paraburkholderia hospita TaxID=169430 RepID=UPI0006874223|nr:aspartyl/asparaginyl beta-hydroxylase domain-containing protein [Paraburkholderia hospita]